MNVTGNRSLAGMRVAVTRAATQVGALRLALEAKGAEVREYPLIRIQPPADRVALNQALAHLPSYDWVVFTSVNGVERFLAEMQASGHDTSELTGAIVAVGPATAAALRQWGLPVAIMPAEYRAEGVLAMMLTRGVTGQKVLVARAAQAREMLPERLVAAGAKVDVVPIYETVPDTVGGERLRQALLNKELDAITFTSASTVRNFCQLVGHQAQALVEGVCVACIGPITASAAAEFDLHVDVVATEYTIPGLVQALITTLSR